jgi:protein-L-isoaspartate(D-aspartate) O-methyltransferase
MSRDEQKRKFMIQGQLLPCGINDATILRAFSSVPREVFIEKIQHSACYCDAPVLFKHNRVMLSPVSLARILQALNIQSYDKVLVIGCITGYSVAILSYLADDVVGLDNDPDWVKKANILLESLDAINAKAVEGELSTGYPHGGPYNYIMIEGGIDYIPDDLWKQLNPEGKIVAIAHHHHNQTSAATVFSKTNGTLCRHELFATDAPILPGFELPQPFEL